MIPNFPRGFDTDLMRDAFKKYHAGETLSDDDIIEIIKLLEPIEQHGWVLDSRFTFFVTEIREMCSRLRGYQSVRIANGSWKPTRDIEQPKFLKARPDA